MKRVAYQPHDAVEIIVDPSRAPHPPNMWESAEYVERVVRGRYRGWHWTRSDVNGQVCVPPGRIRRAL